MTRSEDGVRVRRGRRRDVDRLRALLPDPSDRDGRRARFERRTVASLANDVYVAEDAAGVVVGVVAVAYYRSLRGGRNVAVLDVARAAVERPGLLERLIALAEDRARRRGCDRLAAPGADGDATLRAALAARGYGVATTLVGVLGASV